MSPSTGASARRAGHTFERDVARYLGVPTTRSQRPGIHDDAGDLVIAGWCIELKNYGSPSRGQIAVWHQIAAEKAAVAGLDNVAVITKARNRPLALSHVYLPVTTFSRLVLGYPAHDTAIVDIDLAMFRSYLIHRGVLS